MKRIIEIEEKDYDQICEVVNETESTLGITPFAGSIIAQSKPYDDSGDLISREALKEKLKERYYNDGLNIVTAIELIDNAPPVEPRIEYGTDGQPYKLSMTNGKEYERPKGDCISREALKEQINATYFDFGDYYDNTEEIRKRVCEAIDNAPTVEPFTQLEKEEIADAITYLLDAELLEENGYTEEVIKALKSALKKVGGAE